MVDQYTYGLSSLLIHKDLEQCWVIRRPQTGQRIPSNSSFKTLSTAARIIAYSNIMEGIRVLIQCGVQKANGRLARCKSFLINAIDQNLVSVMASSSSAD